MGNNIYTQKKEFTALMNSYQEYFSNIYQQRLMEAIHGKIDPAQQQQIIEQAVEEDLKNWYNQPVSAAITELEEYDSRLIPVPASSIGDWVDSLQSEEDQISLALHAALICDDTMPRRILTKLYDSGAGIRQRLLDICLETDWEKQDEQSENESISRYQQVCCAFMNVLSQWQSDQTTDLLLQKFSETVDPDDRISEAMGYYLINMGPAAIKPITQEVEKLRFADPDRQQIHEYLLVALASIGQTHKDDLIFATLRSSLRKMQNPLIAAACIGDYGDPRGIRVLRSWLEQKLPAVSPSLYQEAASSIRRLGGDLNGLAHPMFPGGKLD